MRGENMEQQVEQVEQVEYCVADEVVEIKTCKDCGIEFEFKAGEREFYASKGLVEPLRCKDCRAIRKMNNKKKEDKGE